MVWYESVEFGGMIGGLKAYQEDHVRKTRL